MSPGQAMVADNPVSSRRRAIPRRALSGAIWTRAVDAPWFSASGIAKPNAIHVSPNMMGPRADARSVSPRTIRHDPVTIQRRTPSRSSRRPASGEITAATISISVRPPNTSQRGRPRSAAIGSASTAGMWNVVLQPIICVSVKAATAFAKPPWPAIDRTAEIVTRLVLPAALLQGGQPRLAWSAGGVKATGAQGRHGVDARAAVSRRTAVDFARVISGRLG